MALNERLDKFKLQQERCQATLSSIAASQALTPRSNIAPRVQPINGPSAQAKPQQRIKFSDDTERLQRINLVRKSAVGAQIKLVIELLYKRRQALTAEQINEATYVHIHGNKEVFDRLKNNQKVQFDGNRFSYKSKYDLKGKDQLLSLIRDFPEGLPVVDIKDAYLSVLEDLEALKASKDIRWLSTSKGEDGVVFPDVDPKTKIKIDNDIKEFVSSIELPRDMMDIEKELQKSGQPTKTNSAARRRAAAEVHVLPPKPKSRKKRGITSRTKLTNAHLPELFMDLKT
uniref:TFIIE beta domain-containing protein n=1 Tax=Leersia perrieri TaxID=77586 RepID=A0A0D9VQ60_9ORYZ